MSHVPRIHARFLAAILFATASLAPVQGTFGSGFSALITPPRFALQSRPGQVLRQVIEITNVSSLPARIGVQTAEWQFAEDGAVLFENALAPGSCRPWVALETRELELGPNGRRRFRFEIAVPADAAAGECRLAIMFEGEPELVGDLGLPVSGRIGVMVYVTVGDAAPELRIISSGITVRDGVRLPALRVVNEGIAHTRLEGFARGRDAAGREIVFVPENAPILPGQTRTLVLHPQAQAGSAPPQPTFPMRITGRLEWSGTRLDIDQEFLGE
jgi:fimbrial chaperone protein